MFLLLVCGWGKVNDPTSQDRKSQVLDEIREDGSRMDSFYQESLLLEYHFHIPQVEGLSKLHKIDLADTNSISLQFPGSPYSPQSSPVPAQKNANP